MPLPAERLSFPLILRNDFSAPPSSVISLAGRAKHCSPHYRGLSMSMPLPAERLSFPLILRNDFSAPPSSVISLAGRASIAPLTIEGYLWACRSLRSVWVPSHSEEWVLRSPELVIGRASIAPLIRGLSMSMPLPAERLSSFSFWGMSSPLSRARYR